jgi:hypothetical protein
MPGAELPAFRGPGSGGDRIVLTDTAPRPALLSGGPALRAPTPDLVATREQPAATPEVASERTPAPEPVFLPRPAQGPGRALTPRPQLLLAAESVKDPGIVAQEGHVAKRADRAASATEAAGKASTRAGEAIAALAEARQKLAALTEQAQRAAAIAEEARVAAIGAKRNTDVSKTATAARNAAIKADAAVKSAVKSEEQAVENRAETQRKRARKATAATTAQRKLDTSGRYLDALRRGTVRRRAVVQPPRMLTTPNGGRVLDPGFEGQRNDDPRKGHHFSKFPLTDQNYRRMLLGSPPYGADGQPVNLHHRGGEPMGPLDEYRATQHQELGLHKDIEDSRIDRRAFDDQRARYWVERARALLNAL